MRKSIRHVVLNILKLKQLILTVRRITHRLLNAVKISLAHSNNTYNVFLLQSTAVTKRKTSMILHLLNMRNVVLVLHGRAQQHAGNVLTTYSLILLIKTTPNAVMNHQPSVALMPFSLTQA